MVSYPPTLVKKIIHPLAKLNNKKITLMNRETTYLLTSGHNNRE